MQLLLYDEEMRIKANSVSFNPLPSKVMWNRPACCIRLCSSAKTGQLCRCYEARVTDVGATRGRQGRGKTTAFAVRKASCVIRENPQLISAAIVVIIDETANGKSAIRREAAWYGGNSIRFRITPTQIGAHSLSLSHLDHWLYHPILGEW